MFYALCAALCLAALFLVLAGAALICALALRLFRPLLRRAGHRTFANSVFTLRALPLLLALVVTFGFVLPAFLKFEPRSTGELMSWPLLALAALGALVLLVLGMRSLRLIRA